MWLRESPQANETFKLYLCQNRQINEVRSRPITMEFLEWATSLWPFLECNSALAPQWIPHQTIFVTARTGPIIFRDRWSSVFFFFIFSSRSFFIMAPLPSPSSSARVIHSIDAVMKYLHCNSNPSTDSTVLFLANILVKPIWSYFIFNAHSRAVTVTQQIRAQSNTNDKKKKKQITFTYLKFRSANRKEYLRVLHIHNEPVRFVFVVRDSTQPAKWPDTHLIAKVQKAVILMQFKRSNIFYVYAFS